MQKINRFSWNSIKLKDVCTEITVGHVGSMVNEYVDEGIPFLRSQNILPFSLDFRGIKYISPEFHKRLKKSALKPGDVVVVRTGYPGTACVIPETLSVANCADLVIIRPSEQLNSYYLSCIFNSTWGQGTVAGALVGAAQQHFNVSAAKEMSIHLPPLIVQLRIADILSTYDRLIENNIRRIKILEEITTTLYHEWFVNFRFPGHEQVKIVESELGLLPESWEIKKLEEIAFINKSSIKMNSSPKTINYIDIASVTTGKINKIESIDFEKAPSRARRLVQHGDIIWSTVRPNRKSYSLIVKPPSNLVVSTGFAVITPNKTPYTYLYCSLTTDAFANYLTNNATGSAYPAVNSTDFKNADILLPTKDIMQRFHEITESMLIQKYTLLLKNENLTKTRDLLLPKLISGEIDIEELNDFSEADLEAVA